MRTLILAALGAALLTTPALAASKAAASNTTAAPTPTATVAVTKPKGTSKLAVCAKQWDAMGDTGHVKYNDMAKTMKSKKGNKLSGYNVWTSECMKKGAA